ncbi:ferrochelatase [Rickettsiella endosymbiont of Miltochrista miniata]|uniref:ferrochelatase n=1 Tax=Rickettsiella endosymbiont of Miltochrista miniata TaxID=3066239 RepID=UPI00313CF8AF
MKSGLLLINLGTPQASSTRAVRDYLAEFLSDRRVVELPAWFWQPLLRLVILPIRARRTAKLYQSIWMDEGSPLAVYTQRLAEKVQANLGDKYQIVLAMRYGQPSIRAGLKQLLGAGVSSITILPLYPQYSAATTASCLDKISQLLRQSRVIPNLRFIASYFDHPLYIQALANQIKKYRLEQSENNYLLFSFHGLPQRNIELGEPYQQQCFTTVRLIAERLQLSEPEFQIVFQSRFGAAKWLQPYCDVVLQALPARGIKNVTVICPGFAVDCLETLEEISKRYRALFLAAGGENFTYIPALNDSAEQVQLLSSLVH